LSTLPTLHRSLSILTMLCSSLPLFSFFFYSPGDHRDLHSFPTRRSSDLHRRPVRWSLPPAGTERHGDLGRPSWPLRPHWFGTARSEEHTSELQSRENLVCRLLLEKKKKINMRRKRPT